jgi:hypothetical protein
VSTKRLQHQVPLKISFKKIHEKIDFIDKNGPYHDGRMIIFETPGILTDVIKEIHTYEIWDSIGIEYNYWKNQPDFSLLHISGDPVPYCDEVVESYHIINENIITSLNQALSECRKQYFILSLNIKNKSNYK